MHNNETGASVVNARYVHVHKINNILNFCTTLKKTIQTSQLCACTSSVQINVKGKATK